MTFRSCLTAALALYGTVSLARPTPDDPTPEEQQELEEQMQVWQNIDNILSSRWPERPEGVDAHAFPASEFENMDKIAKEAGNKFDEIHPAAAHAPIFMYARTTSSNSPCYPEGGTNAAGDGPNPGTDVPAGLSPGEDCTGPGDYHGANTRGNPFPVYVGASYCGPQEGVRSEGEWLLNYNVYYVHDGVASIEGHKHDWEGITIVFHVDPNKPDSNWYMAKGVIFNRHGHKDYYDWKDIITVDIENLEDETIGTLKSHPKVFVGFYSHAAFRQKCDAKDGCDVALSPGYTSEYRSNDWLRSVAAEDLKLYDTIHGDWDYGDADSTPWKNKNDMCNWRPTWGLSEGPQVPPTDGDENEIVHCPLQGIC